ncbi:MAG: hypothetical protein KIT18_08975 [Burkholderiales bacterium]|nr:hypothetical protein [Burkholderiales bacterium]
MGPDAAADGGGRKNCRSSHAGCWTHALGMSFGLRLPGEIISIAGGDAQRERGSLEALALSAPWMENVREAHVACAIHAG